MKYRKKPVVIDAIQWRGDNEEEVKVFLGKDCRYISNTKEVAICTLEGQLMATVADYIIRGVKGEHYPCKPDIFEATYDKVEGK